MAAQPKEGTKRNHSLRNFKGVNTQADRRAIPDDQFAWLENVMPIGHGNLKSLPGSGDSIFSSPIVGAVYFMSNAVFGETCYMFMFCQDGSAYQVLLSAPYTVTNFAIAGTFSGNGTAMAQWENTQVCIIDPNNGYFTYDGTTLTAYRGTVQSVTVVNAGIGFSAAPYVYPSTGAAAFSSTIGVNLATLNAAGSGYAVGDVLTISGGTFTEAATIEISALTSGAISGFNLTSPGTYTLAPGLTGVATTGGHGSGATFDLVFGVTSVTVIAPGSGYSTAPDLLIGNSSGIVVLDIVSGTYTACPANPVATTTTGAGTGMTLDLTWGVDIVPTFVSATDAGYVDGDELTVDGGIGAAASLLITNAYFDGTNYYYTASITDVGLYDVPPSNPITASGGSGAGYTVNVEWAARNGTIVAAGSGYLTGDQVIASGGTHGSYPTAATFDYSTPTPVNTTTVLQANLGISANGNCIEVYAGRVWIANDRTIVFSSPDSYSDFDPTNLAGSLVMTDNTMKASISRLYSANNYLYIVGASGINVISNVTVTSPTYTSSGSLITPSNTVFSNTNITSSIGTDMAYSLVTLQRSVLFCNDYGIHALTGTTVQKISDDLDGLFPITEGAGDVSAGLVILHGILCVAFLLTYNGGPLLAIFFNKKWFFASQGATNVAIATGYADPDVPQLYGTNGTYLYKLFDESAGNVVSHIIQTKLWDMGNPLITKAALKYGLEVEALDGSIINVSVDSEYIEQAYSVTVSADDAPLQFVNNTGGNLYFVNNDGGILTFAVAGSGYNFLRGDAQNVGNYLGLTITSDNPDATYIGAHLQYEERTPWAGLPW